MTYTDAVPTTEAGKVFYVAVPAQTYHDLKIEIDADGSGNNLIMTTKSETNVTVARNTIYPITFSADKYRGSATKKDGVRVTWVVKSRDDKNLADILILIQIKQAVLEL